jgi:hypothetical protein
VQDGQRARSKLRNGGVWPGRALGAILAGASVLMVRRRRKQSFGRFMAKPLLALAALALLWVGIQLDLHNDIGRLIIAPLAMK